jgi:hypothetical protein
MPQVEPPDRMRLAAARLSGRCPMCGKPLGEAPYGTGRVADGIFCSLECLSRYHYEGRPLSRGDVGSVE